MSITPWWMSDEQYTGATPVPQEIKSFAGPRGIALVRAWPDGRTDRGWGLKPTEKSPGFMKSYMAGKFRSDVVEFGFDSGRWNFAIVMRSVRLVCIDIDGKNGGKVGANKLGMLPRTLAETSKSGDGYHLFYATSEDVWDDDEGYGEFGDRIGLQQGVDLRAIGCVYHHKQQRWNDLPIVELPQHLKDQLKARIQKTESQYQTIAATLDAGDQTEILMMRDALVLDLDKPIPAGRRNNTLFALGSQMYMAGIADWRGLIERRAVDLGLDMQETNKLLNNIERYTA
jgi:hypothetical protein